MPKLNLRNECLKTALGVMALALFNQGRPEDNIQKSRLIYWRLMDIIFKIDHIDSHSSGSQFLNLVELMTDSRLDQKFKSLKVLWISEPQAEQEPQERDWTSVFEAIERDITQLSNDSKFKKMVALFEDDHKSKRIHLDDIYEKGWGSHGPWSQIVDKIRQDLEETGAMKESIERLQEKMKD